MESILKIKSFEFAVEIVKFCRFLQQTQQEFVLSKQLLKSGTAIGALIHEATFAQSKADFISKLTIALKEANESQYWLELLYVTNYLDEESYHHLLEKCKELTAILVSSVKTSKSHL